MTDLLSLTIHKDQKQKTSTGIYAERKMEVNKKWDIEKVCTSSNKIDSIV